MKKRGKQFAAVFAAAAFLAGALFAFETNAVVAAEAEEVKVSEDRSYEVNRLEIPDDAAVLVVVEADGLTANVSAYVKQGLSAGTEGTAVPADGAASEADWQLQAATDAGLIGRGGMGKVQEGDEKTPSGLYRMNTPFGTAAAQAGFPENYLQVDGRYYWDGDSASDRYNKLVNTDEYTNFDRAKSEHLSTYGGAAYHYCIDTGYNFDGTPYKGSALFLHCSAGKNTAGCVAIPEQTMAAIMRLYREGSTYILLDTKGNFAQYYKKNTAETAGAPADAATDPAETRPDSSSAETKRQGPCVLSGSCK